MNFYDDRDFDDLHDECVRQDDAVSYALENHWDEVEDQILSAQDEAWLSDSKPFVEILSAVSQRDRSHLQALIRNRLRGRRDESDKGSDPQLFEIAADVAGLVEQLGATTSSRFTAGKVPDYQRIAKPTPAQCIGSSGTALNLEDDLSWANDLLILTRAFRDFLSAVSDDDPHNSLLTFRVREPIEVFNNYLQRAPQNLLIYWKTSNGEVGFGRSPDPEKNELCSLVANWISDYLTTHSSRVGLGICAECGKLFARERRDRTFCSKTCQNKVAYKRKRIFQNDVLLRVNISPDDACNISGGLWMHHPRFGLGLIESVSCDREPLLSLLKAAPAGPSEQARYKSMLSRRIRLEVRFVHGVRRFGYSELFAGQKTEDQVPTFYSVKSEETLADLL